MELRPAPLPGPPPSIAVRAVLALRNKLRALLDAASPPELALFDRMTGAGTTILVGTVAKWGIPDLLERGPMSAARIAEETNANPDAVFRAMRALALAGIFRRLPDGRFENNRLSTALRSGMTSRTREFAIYFASASNIRAWMAMEHVLRTGKNGFEHANGKDVWAWFDEHPDERDTFAQAMMGMTATVAPTIATLYPWNEVRVVCDVGGGRGTLLSELLVRHPHLRAILCDAQGVLDSAPSLFEARGVAERVQCIPGSFFAEVPSGADAYVLKSVLHDWDDERSRTILRNVRRALQPGQKVILCEALVERDTDEVMGALLDVQMMMVCGEGRERGRAEFAALLSASGFELGRIFESPLIAVIEGVAR